MHTTKHRPRAERLRYELRRARQTRRTFVNWPTLLAQMAAAKLRTPTGELQFRTRSGMLVASPNVPGARLPLYEQFAEDAYDLTDLLVPYQGRPISVFDIGSHIGSFALNVASRHSTAQIWCFEPSPQTARLLRRNVEQNALSDRIRVQECALAGTAGTASLDDNDGGSVHNGLLRDESRLVHGADHLDSRRSVQVRTTTFDRAVADASRAPDLVKLDCEGGEYELVYASHPESWSSVKRVVLEYHPVDGQSWTELSAWFARAGLDLVRHEPIQPGLGTAWLNRAEPC
ncbi:MAG: FkbM family methyltransferase [Actinomycetota bacterium]|nr:FkbM family methyltransferase [Actinomycetota bacterium]